MGKRNYFTYIRDFGIVVAAASAINYTGGKALETFSKPYFNKIKQESKVPLGDENSTNKTLPVGVTIAGLGAIGEYLQRRKEKSSMKK